MARKLEDDEPWIEKVGYEVEDDVEEKKDDVYGYGEETERRFMRYSQRINLCSIILNYYMKNHQISASDTIFNNSKDPHTPPQK